jgi:hypothetical protein
LANVIPLDPVERGGGGGRRYRHGRDIACQTTLRMQAPNKASSSRSGRRRD